VSMACVHGSDAAALLLPAARAPCPRRSDAAALLLPAAGAPAVGAQGAAPVAEGAGDTEQRIRRTVPDLPRGNLTVVVLKSLLQMYGGGGRSEETRSNWTPRQWKRL
jgi:hypothetical protein